MLKFALLYWHVAAVLHEQAGHIELHGTVQIYSEALLTCIQKPDALHK